MELVTTTEQIGAAVPAPISPFGSLETFEAAQRMAKALAASTFIPKEFRNNIGDCLILLETAARTGMPIMALLQNMYVVYGKPSFSSAFMAGLINNSRRFDGPLKFHYNDDKTECYAYATKDGEEYRGITVSMEMARAEGWLSKKGSKWQTMPQLMLQYRATSFFARAYCADLIMGMRPVDELVDMGQQGPVIVEDAADNLNDKFSAPAEAVKEDTSEVKTRGARTRPKVIKSFKDEIDLVETAEKLDTWRYKHQSRIARDLPKESDQQEVYQYAQERYERLKNAEQKEAEAAGNESATGQPELIHACPAGKGNVPESYCNGECGSRQGCPEFPEPDDLG